MTLVDRLRPAEFSARLQSREGKDERRLAIYLTLITLAAIPVIAVSIPGALHPHGPFNASLVLLLGLITIGGELVPIKVARGRQAGDEVSVSSAFDLALLLIAPLGIVILAQAIGLLLDESLRRGRWLRLPFNIAQYALALGASRAVMIACGFSAPQMAVHPRGEFLVAFAGAGLAFFVVNNGLTGVAVALKLHAPVAQQLLDDVRWDAVVALPMIGLAPAVLVVVLWTPWALILVMAPLLAVHRSGLIAVRREHEALHDSLTGLPNRALLNSTLERRLAASESVPVALLLMDLDHFKEINDTLGHQLGDELLRQVAGRISSELGDEGLVARLGGDEFAILIPAPQGTAAAVAIADRLVTSLTTGFACGDMQLDIRGSIGIGVAPVHAQTSEDLMRVADVALYRAKENRGTAALYDRAADTHSLTKLALHSDLLHAIESGGIRLEYQPQIDSSGVLTGVEALARWRHPELGDISPEIFIPIAESTGLIDALTRHVLVTGCDQLIAWGNVGLDIALAVNLSARQLNDTRLPALVGEILRDAGVDHSKLVLEVTESTVIGDQTRGGAVLDGLRRMGVQLSIDDFGTGYSSLSYLATLRVDEMKIDRSFVCGLLSSTRNQAIVRSTIELAHSLGLRVIAEGVDDVTITQQLLAWGCDRLQGYAIGMPMGAEAIVSWEGSRTPDPTMNLTGLAQARAR